jgi:hypothetical protein
MLSSSRCGRCAEFAESPSASVGLFRRHAGSEAADNAAQRERRQGSDYRVRADCITDAGAGTPCRLMDLDGGTLNSARNALCSDADRFSNFTRDCIPHDCPLCQ